MNIKRIISGSLLSMFLALNTAQTPAAYADADGGFSQSQIASSPLKPTLSVSRIKLNASEAASSRQTIKISVKGADKNYCSTGIHVYYDKRLSLVPAKANLAASKGSAAADLSTESLAFENCIFLATAGKTGSGLDGDIWSFTLQLPDDAADGDIYPIRIVYEKGKITEDCFVNDATNRDSLLMQAWLFTNGIENGYIQVGDRSFGDSNCDGKVDLSDAVLIMQCVSNPDQYSVIGKAKGHITEKGYKNADVYSIGDGVTSKDALSIQKYMLKMLKSLPEG